MSVDSRAEKINQEVILLSACSTKETLNSQLRKLRRIEEIKDRGMQVMVVGTVGGMVLRLDIALAIGLSFVVAYLGVNIASNMFINRRVQVLSRALNLKAS